MFEINTILSFSVSCKIKFCLAKRSYGLFLHIELSSSRTQKNITCKPSSQQDGEAEAYPKANVTSD